MVFAVLFDDSLYGLVQSLCRIQTRIDIQFVSKVLKYLSVPQANFQLESVYVAMMPLACI